jgi:hypothetical protein
VVPADAEGDAGADRGPEAKQSCHAPRRSNDKRALNQREYRPPTQSQNSNMLFTSMPNLETSIAAVLPVREARAHSHTYKGTQPHRGRT